MQGTGWYVWFRGIEKKELAYVFFSFLAFPHGLRDLSSPTRDWTWWPWQWKHWVLTAGPPGNTQNLHMLNLTIYLFLKYPLWQSGYTDLQIILLTATSSLLTSFLFFSGKKYLIVLSNYLTVACASKPCPLSLKKKEKIYLGMFTKISSFIYSLNKQ